MTVTKKIDDLLSEYRRLKKYPKTKRDGKKFLSDLAAFKLDILNIFDIVCDDKARLKQQESIWGVEMNSDAWDLHKKNSQVPQVGYSSSFVDIRWKLTQERKERRSMGQARLRAQQTAEIERVHAKTSHEEAEKLIFDEDTENLEPPDPKDISYEPNTEHDNNKHQYVPTQENPNDDMPWQYRHVRNGLRTA